MYVCAWEYVYAPCVCRSLLSSEPLDTLDQELQRVQRCHVGTEPRALEKLSDGLSHLSSPISIFWMVKEVGDHFLGVSVFSDFPTFWNLFSCLFPSWGLLVFSSCLQDILQKNSWMKLTPPFPSDSWYLAAGLKSVYLSAYPHHIFLQRFYFFMTF